MSELWQPGPVLLGGDVPWKIELLPHYASSLLLYLTSHEPNQIRWHVLPALKIENAAPLDLDELADAVTKRRQIKNRRNMLKGLAMELLMAAILRHIDKPPRVVAWAETKDGLPNRHAPSGCADVTAEYPELTNRRPMKVLAEVSAKKEMDPDSYLAQLTSGFKHAQREIEESPDLLVYCLLVNCGRIYEDGALHTLYRNFLREHELTLDSNIRMVPMYAPDFSTMTGTLASELRLADMYFDPDVLATALDDVYELITRPNLPSEEEWMIELFVDSIRSNLPAGSHDPGA